MVSQKSISALQQLSVETLGQLREVLARMEQSLYTTVNVKGNASIGQHVRHTLEFYLCLFDAKESVNYDLRKRDILIESSPEHANMVLERIINQLGSSIIDKPLRLTTEVNDGEHQFDLPSSLTRELFYVMEHAVHHMALVRVLIKDQQPDFYLDDSFGVAYSTIAYRGKTANG